MSARKPRTKDKGVNKSVLKDFAGQTSRPCSAATCGGIEPVRKRQPNYRESISELPVYKDVVIKPKPPAPKIAEPKPPEPKVKLSPVSPKQSEPTVLGFYENEIKKTVRIKRTRNRDGTIREEKETVLEQKQSRKPDPGMSTNDEFLKCSPNISFKSGSYDERSITKAVQSVTVDNQLYFPSPLQTKSLTIPRRSSLAEIFIRQCVSFDEIKDNNT